MFLLLLENLGFANEKAALRRLFVKQGYFFPDAPPYGFYGPGVLKNGNDDVERMLDVYALNSRRTHDLRVGTPF
jgi:hypothetical protein